MVGKHMSRERVGFNAANATFNCVLLVNGALLVAGAVYWGNHGIDSRYLVIGFFGGIAEALGKVLTQLALAIGPVGPATAIIQMSSVWLVVVEAVRLRRAPSGVEFIALALSVVGSLLLVVPQVFFRLFSCCIKAKSGQATREPRLLTNDLK